MRKIVFSIAMSIACAAPAFAKDAIKISGTITNPLDAKVFVVNATNTGLAPTNNQHELPLSESGSFEVEVPAETEYNWIILVNGNQRTDVIVKKGSELTVKIDGSNFDSTLRFEGKGKELPQFFATKSVKGLSIMEYYKALQSMATADPAAYSRAADSLNASEESYLKKNSAGLPAGFVEYWKNFLFFSRQEAALAYPTMHEIQRTRSYTVQNIPPELYAVSNAVPATFDDKYLSIGNYQNYAMNYYGTQLSAKGFTNVVSEDPVTRKVDRSKALQQTDSVLSIWYASKARKTAELIAARSIAQGAKAWTLEELEQRIEVYKKQFPKSPNGKSLDDIAREIKKFNPGQPAVNFKFITLEGKEMQLSDLKGKVVYMDFWASWCGPCKGEMPHAKKIKEHFSGKDVVFLYVSIDEKEDAWKAGIKAMDISGMHTRTPGWGGPIAKLYNIQSVPAYYLIDKEGKFVLKSTPRPSQSAAVIAEIEKLL